MSLIKFTNRELKVMYILWESDRALTASEIFEFIGDNKFSIFSIQNALQSLLSKNAVAVASYTKVFKTTARKYKPAISSNDYAFMQFSQYYSPKESKSDIPNLVSTLIKSEGENIDKETLDELEKLIEIKKAQYKQAQEKNVRRPIDDNNLEHSDHNNH
ncbi:BlaI/MecI/CopY family transcriptional regulator [Lacrimispora algidixylanolytica]|uniref:Penicillinase repressor n=1 Tax=Lacrimispora algidixylanolytica TaxID=94868 RepID=A0A419SVK6_9FIRM|nr:BlaI/MecI/CopY family transcriptional regulator [Lacrimispora algidixylanolytica]RKD29263.1 hypothetical protein BET01_07860 [Lacrimispora algidixylanolytica]